MLLPMYFLIGIWGGPRKEYAAIKFFLYTLAGSVLMLLALIAPLLGKQRGRGTGRSVLVNRRHAGGAHLRHDEDDVRQRRTLYAAAALTILGLQVLLQVVWVGLFIGFAIKVPMFPFHTWLPDAHVEAPTAISVILAGVLLKMGIVRHDADQLPDPARGDPVGSTMRSPCSASSTSCTAPSARWRSPTSRSWSLTRRSATWASVCWAWRPSPSTGMNGSLMLQMFNHGTITSMLFILVGVIYDRAHTRDINSFGGARSA